ncbi:helix-turn-helix domain-containing protein [Patescibacteria group bacterium]|nr:helix-turn-helix domain-containing protein [Patescibacteria group bacterium]
MAYRKINQDLDEADPFNRLYADLRGAVWGTQRNGGTWQSLADKANIGTSTVAKFATGDTKRPHLRTATALAEACGLRFALVSAKTPTLPGEVKLSPAERGALTQKRRRNEGWVAAANIGCRALLFHIAHYGMLTYLYGLAPA